MSTNTGTTFPLPERRKKQEPLRGNGSEKTTANAMKSKTRRHSTGSRDGRMNSTNLGSASTSPATSVSTISSPRTSTSSNGTPPLYPTPNKKRDSSSSRKSNSSSGSNRQSRNFDTQSPSSSANNDEGRRKLNEHWGSVLSHECGLKLMCAMHNIDTPVITSNDEHPNYKFSVSELTIEGHTNDLGDKILENAVNEWFKKPKPLEPTLTKNLSDDINESDVPLYAANEVTVYYKGRKYGAMDVVLFGEESNYKEKSTPSAVVEFGLGNHKWWSKFHQNCKYVQAMLDTRHDMKGSSEVYKNQLKLDEPMLFGVVSLNEVEKAKKTTPDSLSVDAVDDAHLFESANFGVFLCVPSTRSNKFQMILLWNETFSDLKQLSSAFGRFLRVVKWFSDQRLTFGQPSAYEYLSSCCCRIGDKVLRSYDGRFRVLNRSPEIYLSNKQIDSYNENVVNCQQITGEVSPLLYLEMNKKNNPGFWTPRTVTTIPADNEKKSCLTDIVQKRGFLILSIPYKEGRHYATKPSDFIPLIDQLQKLHNLGFVHGDIRAFNVVIENKANGGLIDFDFGGSCGTVKYPLGYRSSLDDGRRVGKEGKVIEKNDDWFAMGQLMFNIHFFNKKKDVKVPSEMDDIFRFWKCVQKDVEVSDSHLKRLKDFLEEADDLYDVVLNRPFQDMFDSSSEEGEGSIPMTKKNKKGTGSPPKDGNQFHHEDVHSYLGRLSNTENQ